MSTYEETLRIPGKLDEGRVLLFDGHSHAYRAFYGIPELTTHTGQPVNAVFGFWRILLRTLRSYPSSYVAVVFDAGGKTFRHEIYPEYKANRKPMPEELAIQFPLIERLLAALGIQTISVSGVEADDVLASISLRAVERDLGCLIATSDKDMAQVVSDRICLLRPGDRRIDTAQQLLDPAGVLAKYGVPPEQIVDFLSLVGDASDNVPGIPGVGGKTAALLLQQFGSLEAALDSADKVRNRRVAAGLATHRKDAEQARRLIRLRLDVELDEIPAICGLQGIDLDGLARILTELEFDSALSELGLEPAARTTDRSLPGPARPVVYHAILEREALHALVNELRKAEIVSLDLETTSLDPIEARIVGIALSLEPCVGYYIPIGHEGLGAPAQLPLNEVLAALRPMIEGETPGIIGQNLKYDLIVLRRHGVNPDGISFDSMIASHLVHPEERRHNLEQIAMTYLGHSMLTYEEVAGRDGLFAAVPIDLATEYAAEDAEIVQRLYPPLLRDLEQGNLSRLFRDVEIPLIPVLARMEEHGILVDTDVLGAQGDELRTELQIVEADLMDLAGGPFNPNSPKQVGEILFERFGLPIIDRTKTGPSTSARVLSILAEQHPFPGKLLAHRELKKLLTTYIDQLPKALHPSTGRIHTSFHQTATATGRLSSSDPNLQNIPTRTEIGGRIRAAFVAPEGSSLVAADYSQIELRLLAHFSEDERLIEAFHAGLDLHRLTASVVFGLPEEQVPDRLRDAAKRINFGILYGISPFGLARELGIPQSEAKGYIDRFFSAYPGAKEYIDRMIERATESGFVETIYGRRRPLANLTSRNVARRNFDRRNAINTPIQGSAADLIKLAMIEIDRWIEDRHVAVKMILQIHDELIFEIEIEILAEATAMIVEKMEGVLPLRVPLSVKVASGSDWNQL
jgi:DNA polymerase-1